MFHQGGLAGAVVPQDGNNVSLVDGAIHAGQHFRQVFFVAEMDIFEFDQRFPVLALQAGREWFHWFTARSFHHDGSRQLYLGIIHALQQTWRVPVIHLFAVLKVKHLLRVDRQHVFDAVLHQDDRNAVVRQPAENGKRFTGRSRVEAGKRFIQQQDARAHGKHPCQGDFLFFTSRKLEGLAVFEEPDIEVIHHIIYPLEDLFARQTQVLQSEGDLIKNKTAHDLPVGVLQHGADLIRDLCQAHFLDGLAEDLDHALQGTAVRVRDQTIDAAHQGGFAAAGRTCQEQDLARIEGEVEGLDRRSVAAGVLEGEVSYNQGLGIGHGMIISNNVPVFYLISGNNHR